MYKRQGKGISLYIKSNPVSAIQVVDTGYILSKKYNYCLLYTSISVNTPIEQGLLGKKVGEVAEITVPQGKIALEVVNISF